MTPTTPTTPTDLASRRRAMQLEAQRRFDLAGLPRGGRLHEVVIDGYPFPLSEDVTGAGRKPVSSCGEEPPRSPTSPLPVHGLPSCAVGVNVPPGTPCSTPQDPRAVRSPGGTLGEMS